MDSKEKVQIRLFDLDGRAVWQRIQSCNSGFNDLLLDLPQALAAGIYHANISAQSGTQTVKMVKIAGE